MSMKYKTKYIITTCHECIQRSIENCWQPGGRPVCSLLNVGIRQNLKSQLLLVPLYQRLNSLEYFTGMRDCIRNLCTHHVHHHHDGQKNYQETNSIRRAAVAPFFHLYLPVRIRKYLRSNTYNVYAPNIAGMKNCNSLNRTIAKITIAASNNTCRIILADMRFMEEKYLDSC